MSLNTQTRRRILMAIICGGLIISLSMGIRQSFGLLLAPLSIDLGLNRESFAFAMAVQHLIWGLSQPLTGMLADRFGSGRVIVVGAVLYSIGLWIMGHATTGLDLTFGSGLLIGMGAAGTGFAVVLGAVGRIVPENKRSMALGIVSAGGSFGQFICAPVFQQLMEGYGWQGALLIFMVLALMMAFLSFAVTGRASDVVTSISNTVENQSIRGAIKEAFAHRGFLLLAAGFFVCGFQVIFIAVHLPAYVGDIGLDAKHAAFALSLVGFFNIIGTFGCGALGDRYSKKLTLSYLYFARSIVITLFVLAPASIVSLYAFAAAIGLLWLGTVPLTSGLIAQMLGVKYMSTLFGFVFLSHQLGSFLGAWGGGYVFDQTGSYNQIWIVSVILGVVAGLLHLPIDESPRALSSEPAKG